MFRIFALLLLAGSLSQPAFATPPCSSPLQNGDILLVGDSHTVGYFGQNLATYLLQQTNKPVARYANIGSAATHWAHDTVSERSTLTVCNGTNVRAASLPSYKEMLSDGGSPTAVIIALGSNDSIDWCGFESQRLKNPKKTPEPNKTLAAVSQMIQQIPAPIPCFWVGPPDYSDTATSVGRKCAAGMYQNYVRALRTEVEKQKINGRSHCQYIDSSQMHSAPVGAANPCEGGPALASNITNDLHFSLKPSQDWARCVAYQIQNQLRSSTSTSRRADQKTK